MTSDIDLSQGLTHPGILGAQPTVWGCCFYGKRSYQRGCFPPCIFQCFEYLESNGIESFGPSQGQASSWVTQLTLSPRLEPPPLRFCSAFLLPASPGGGGGWGSFTLCPLPQPSSRPTGTGRVPSAPPCLPEPTPHHCLFPPTLLPLTPCSQDLCWIESKIS